MHQKLKLKVNHFNHGLAILIPQLEFVHNIPSKTSKINIKVLIFNQVDAKIKIESYARTRVDKTSS